MPTIQSSHRRLFVLTLAALGNLGLAVLMLRGVSEGAPLVLGIPLLVIPAVGLGLIAREVIRDLAAAPVRTLEEMLGD